MSLKYIAITANCGNDTLGPKASNAIFSQFKKNELDFCVINCQETDFPTTQHELQSIFGSDYQVRRAGDMVTRTKIDLDPFSNNKGMGSIIIHRADVTVKIDSPVEARRDPSAHYGTAFNKGGVISNCIVIKDNESLQLQLVSGHLDSNKTMERAKDWQVIQNSLATSKEDVTHFSDLIHIIPDLRISGYDANTRNKIIDTKPMNMWKNDTYELEGLKQMPLGSARFSAESTYKSDHPDIETTPAEGKRQGFTKGGMLDFIDVMDVSAGNGTIEQANVVIHPDDPNTKRDHAVIISPPMYTLTHENGFNQVKNYMASMLENAAPDFSKELRNLPENSKNKIKLVNIYNDFLSNEGLLHKELQLFITKLSAIKTASKSGKNLELQAKEILFADNSTWFPDLKLDNYKSQLQMIEIKQNSTKEDIDRVQKWHQNDNSSLSSLTLSSVSMDSHSSKSSRPNSLELEQTYPHSPSQASSPNLKSKVINFMARYKTNSPTETSVEKLDHSSYSPGNKGA